MERAFDDVGARSNKPLGLIYSIYLFFFSLSLKISGLGPITNRTIPL